MATTTPKIVEEITHVRTGPFAVNYSSGDFIAGSLNAELIAAPTRTNSATYVTHVTMGIVADSSGIVVDARLTLVDGVGTDMFGPVQFVDSGTTVFSKDFTKPMKVTDNKSLDVSGSAVNGAYQAAAWVYVEYYTGDNPLT
jgi:hypothetical protein